MFRKVYRKFVPVWLQKHGIHALLLIALWRFFESWIVFQGAHLISDKEARILALSTAFTVFFFGKLFFTIWLAHMIAYLRKRFSWIP